MRAAVESAAVDVLLERGIDGLTIAEVAHRAGVHETSIYRRWGGRANLAVVAVLHATQADLGAPDTGSLRGDLLALLRELAAFASTPRGDLLVRLALRQDRPEYEVTREKFRAERLRAAAVVFDRAEARGELRPGIDRGIALATLIGPLHVRLLLTREPLTDEFLCGVVDLVLTGLTPPPPA